MSTQKTAKVESRIVLKRGLATDCETNCCIVCMFIALMLGSTDPTALRTEAVNAARSDDVRTIAYDQRNGVCGNGV